MDGNEQRASSGIVPYAAGNSKLPSLCKVCGTDGAQMHYGALCCVSCKMFFRRNLQFNLDVHNCVFNEKCDITINSRRACRYCRLQKCFTVGMARELIRAPHCRREKKPTKVASLPATVDFRSHDHSFLSADQWSRLSNVINTYEIKSPVSSIRSILSSQLKQPVKIRLKMDKTIFSDILLAMYRAIMPFIETLPEFRSMKGHDRCELMERNLSLLGGFNGIPVFRHAEVTFSTAFENGFPSIYGSKIAENSTRIARRADSDLTLIKLFLPVILFSTAYYVNVSAPTTTHYQFIPPDTNSIFSKTVCLLHIQNIYIEVLFKYMIYRFGYEDASSRFAALIKCFLDQSMCILQASEVQTHDALMRTLIEQTESTLALEDVSMDVDIL